LLGGGDQIYCDSIWKDVPALAKLDTWAKRQDAKVSPTLERSITGSPSSPERARSKSSGFAG